MAEKMKIAHILRKYNANEWAGTESALKRLLEGFKKDEDVESLVFCPKINQAVSIDPLAEEKCEIIRFSAFLPVWGISEVQKQRLVSIGGNLMSFQLLWLLWKTPNLSIIHTHTLGLFGGIALLIAKLRNIPLVVSIHGGALDLSAQTKKDLLEPLKGGIVWGKILTLLFRTHYLLQDADAILTLNRKEADYLQAKYPRQRIVIYSHAVSVQLYQHECRKEACEAFPQIVNKKLLLLVGRIDPVKNQGWVIEQMPSILKKYPDAFLLIAGPCTDKGYKDKLEELVRQLGMQNNVLFTGALLPEDPRLIGLFQQASAVVLPSIAEPFGIVILEAWAAGTLIISSRTSGAEKLIKDGENGYLFDLENSESFFHTLEQAFNNEETKKILTSQAKEQVIKEYDTTILATKMKALYEELIEKKNESL